MPCDKSDEVFYRQQSDNKRHNVSDCEERQLARAKCISGQIEFEKLIAGGGSMVGTARKKENSAAVFLFNPWVNPPIMVAAERETPGIIAMH